MKDVIYGTSGDFNILDQSGNDATSAMDGSGSEFTLATNSSTQTGKIIITPKNEDGPTELMDISFSTSGGTGIALEIYGQQGFRVFWQNVSKPDVFKSVECFLEYNYNKIIHYNNLPKNM